MADFNFKTWETMNVEDWYFPSLDTYFIILDHESLDPSNENDIIYSGVKPASTNMYNNLENILSPRVGLETDQAFPETYYPTAFGNRIRKTFYLYETMQSDDWESDFMESIEVEYDWSYIPNRAYMSELSDPIEYKVDPRQYLVWTSQQVVPGTPNRLEVDVNGTNVYWTLMTQADYTTTLHLLVGDYAGYTPGTTLTINHLANLTLTDTCADYCLYYANRLGGWDWLLVKGKSLQKDKLSRLTYKKRYTAQQTQQDTRNKINYTTIIGENWELSTSWLNDIQSEKVPVLLESNAVYLHDLKTGITTPVIITNSTAEYKTYKNQGRKLYSYTIEVESSKPKYRL